MKRLTTAILSLCLFTSLACTVSVPADHVCTRYGQWSMTRNAYHNDNDFEERKCVICGAIQRRRPSVWYPTTCEK